MRDARLRAAGAVLGLLVLSGCGAPVPVAAGPGPGPTTEAAASPTPSGVGVLAESRPSRLAIPTLDVDSDVMVLGLRDDGTMEVPPDATTTGWYDRSPTPGELGPAVLAAHVDWKGEQGVFSRLAEMAPGDEVHVRRADGITAVFAVREVEQYPKDAFPSDDVYGDVDGPELRLITCGGEFDDAAGSYEDNVVVYAELIGSA